MIFDLTNVPKEQLNLPEFINYLLRQDQVEIYLFCFQLLDNGFVLSSNERFIEVENFFTNPKIRPFMETIWKFINDEELINYVYSNDPKYLAVSIANLRLSYSGDKEDLKKLEDKYYIKRKRKLKLKNIETLYEKEGNC